MKSIATKIKELNVVMIERLQEFSIDVAKTANELGIQFVGVRWIACMKPIDGSQEFSMDVARKQIEVLNEKRVWLSDKEARYEINRDQGQRAERMMS
jgi:hypothetical protein